MKYIYLSDGGRRGDHGGVCKKTQRQTKAYTGGRTDNKQSTQTQTTSRLTTRLKEGYVTALLSFLGVEKTTWAADITLIVPFIATPYTPLILPCANIKKRHKARGLCVIGKRKATEQHHQQKRSEHLHKQETR